MRSSFRMSLFSLIYAVSFAAGSTGKETLVIKLGTGDKILDTAAILVDYGAPPKVPPSGGGNWADHEEDSAWTVRDSIRDSENGGFIYYDSKWVRYNHFFHAVKNGRNGVGADYISYKSGYGGEPEYIANISFSFLLGDTVESWGWDPAHFKDNLYLEAGYSGGLKAGTGSYGELNRVVGGTGVSPRPWLQLIRKEAGWKEQPTPINAGLLHGGFPQGGWFSASGARSRIRVPEGAKVLRIFDTQGRLYWEKPLPGLLREVEVPGGLPAVPLRYQWTVLPQ
jgi:hypothetical protein